ncbi:RHS repeat-associated core domain-containing protein, partial [Sinomicrobium oceani]
YDKNGNIEHLTRRGHLNSGATSFGVMDNLAYAYDTGNKLLKVTDSGNKTYGFKDGTNTNNDYTYDANGNLLTDANKGITGISYNHLNLPTQVSFGSNKIAYIYDASGTKLKKEVTQGSSVTRTEYAGNYIYENSQLKQVSHPEGYFEPKAGGGYQYVYYLKDHQNNVRITFADDNNDGSVNSSEIRKERNFYPFGLEHRGYNGQTYGVKNNLKTFQDQEFTEDLGLNTHEWKYRFSDPAIGRFWQVDPLAQEYAYQSPYNFSENRVIDGVELEGAERLSVHTPNNVYSAPVIRNEHPTKVAINAATAGVIARHPIATSNVGYVKHGGTNITSISGRIARHAAENGNMTVGEGSQRNALRHATWVATIKSNYGESAAQRIGNAHEAIDMGANAHVDFGQPAPDNLLGADSVVDFLNNEIGRQIGAELGEGATEWEAAVKALDVQLNEGLWTATKDKDGNITISRTKITQEQYNTAMKTLRTLNRYGMNDADRKDLEEKKN